MESGDDFLVVLFSRIFFNRSEKDPIAAFFASLLLLAVTGLGVPIVGVVVDSLKIEVSSLTAGDCTVDSLPCSLPIGLKTVGCTGSRWPTWEYGCPNEAGPPRPLLQLSGRGWRAVRELRLCIHQRSCE